MKFIDIDEEKGAEGFRLPAAVENGQEPLAEGTPVRKPCQRVKIGAIVNRSRITGGRGEIAEQVECIGSSVVVP